MVIIFGARFVPEFDMNREYRGMRTGYILAISVARTTYALP
jgi:hypothetical protein